MKGYLVTAAAAAVVGTAIAAQVLDDGIEGCLNIEGRAHFQYDDGTVSPNPIVPLNFADNDESCYVSHGGGAAGDSYPLLNSRSRAEELAHSVAGFTSEEFATFEAQQIVDGIANPFEAVEATFDQYGRISFQDAAGEVVKQGEGLPIIMAAEFSEAIHSVQAGDETHPDGVQADTAEWGTAVVVTRTSQGPLAAYTVPARQPNGM